MFSLTYSDCIERKVPEEVFFLRWSLELTCDEKCLLGAGQLIFLTKKEWITHVSLR